VARITWGADMIRYLRLMLLVLLGLSLLTVALANRAPVSVRLLPDDLAALTGLTWAAELPLFLVIFAGIIAGVLIGFVWEWFREHGHRATASQKSREVTRLERELAVLKDSSSVPPKDDVLALLEKR
jgi:lipopolysaccharide assembly protein A